MSNKKIGVPLQLFSKSRNLFKIASLEHRLVKDAFGHFVRRVVKAFSASVPGEDVYGAQLFLSQP